jgi:flagellar assembly factor FliW
MSASTVAVPQHGVVLQSEVLGPLTVAREDIIDFPNGMYGFPEAHTFALLRTPRDGIYWLQSADFSALAFLLVDPFIYFPGYYHIELGETELHRLGSRSPSDLLVLAIVTMPPSPRGAYTANLQAPILFNVKARHGFQSIRPEDGFGVREPFDVETAPPQAL